MLRGLGCIMIAVSFAIFGEAMIGRQKRRIHTLEAFLNSLEQMEHELKLRMLPLQDLMEVLSKTDYEPVGKFFRNCIDSLELLEIKSFAESWSEELRKVDSLEAGDRDILEVLGQSLGRYTGGDQARDISEVHARLRAELSMCRNELAKRSPVYRSFSAAGCVFLIVLLL